MYFCSCHNHGVEFDSDACRDMSQPCIMMRSASHNSRQVTSHCQRSLISILMQLLKFVLLVYPKSVSLTSFQTYFTSPLVLCHFQSLFRNFEIVLQGGHGELSQWCWRWHEAQGGVTRRCGMFRFFSNFHGPRLREIGTVPQLVPCNSAKCQKQSLFRLRHLHIPSVVPVMMFGTRQHKTSLRVYWLSWFLILLVCLFGCFSAGSGHHPWCLQNAPALCGGCLSQPRREAGSWEC